MYFYYIFTADLSQGRFAGLKEVFLKKGLMAIELLEYCLQHFSLSLESRDIFVDLMLKFDLCYEVVDPPSAPETIGCKKILQFPWFLTIEPTEDLDIKWPQRVNISCYDFKRKNSSTESLSVLKIVCKAVNFTCMILHIYRAFSLPLFEYVKS